jgi:hypothetical protein
MQRIGHARRRIFVLLAATLTAIGLAVTAGATAASAAYDDGNPQGQQLVCENYEICFTWASSTTNDLKQFWYSANHGAVSGSHVAYFFHPNGQRLMDNSWKLRNRDSSCTVYVWDIDSFGNWYVYASQGRQAGGYLDMSHDRNNGHSRCTNTSPPRNL